MLKSYLISCDGVAEQTQLAEAVDQARKTKGILWVDLRTYDSSEVQQIAGLFSLHAVEVETLHEEYTRPHVYEYEDHIHANFTHIDSVEDEVRPEEFHVFLGANFIITAGSSVAGELIDDVLKRYRDLPALSERGSYYALYLLTDLLTDSYIHVADDMDDQVDNLEDEMSTQPDRKTLQHLFQIKRKLFDLRRYLAPQRDVFNELARGSYSFIQDSHEAYFQDVYNRMSRVFDVMDTSRDILSGTLDLYQSSVSNKLNDIMKILTVFAVVLGVFSFITGYFGMNVADFPKMPLWGLALWSLGLLVIITIGLLVVFRKKGWL